jgi:methylmalonyl-CoA/ethylmalonyl-CoA epimerase
MHKYLKFHHFGLATENIAKSKKHLERFGYKFSKTITDENQKVNLSIGTRNNFPSIELVGISKKFKQNPLSNFLNKYDENIYHICFEVTNLKKFNFENFVKKLNYVNILKPTPAKLFNYRKVSFYKIKNIGLVEFLE